MERYLNYLKGAGYTKFKTLPKGVIFEKDNSTLLLLKIEDETNIYILLAKGNKDDVLKIAGLELTSFPP
ncbi:hypothetical protein APY94_11615 [Thermococcus celericrescens]|uniref:Uncharacterized protein n=1 Tax=Thermococcus celericrescens TaxID=227598 RepID=A0A117IST7_9EURY|nr:hypothetical protein [Thermococcus celericrescens]KUH31887.1 hypothetical protein APY94_11615 [Thermococcus celericrescens]